MSRKSIYLALAIIGGLLPWLFFANFFASEGLSGDFVGALFVNGAAGGFSVDLLISSLVFWVFLYLDSHRTRMPRPWLFILINLLIGLSCALPLFLFWREDAANQTKSPERSPQ